MKKPSKNIIVWATTVFAALCGVIAFFVVFAEAVHCESILFGDSFTGLQVGLGYSVEDGFSSITIFKASAGIILAYLFPLVAACILIVGKGNSIAGAIGAAMMITGGILAFCIVQLLNGSYLGEPSLGAGAITSGVFSIVGGLAACGSTCLISLKGSKKK